MPTERTFSAAHDALSDLIRSAMTHSGDVVVTTSEGTLRLTVRAGVVVAGSSTRPLPSVVDLAVEYQRVNASDRDVALTTPDALGSLIAWGALAPDVVAALEFAALTIGFGRVFAEAGPWTLRLEDDAGQPAPPRQGVQSHIVEFVRRGLATCPSESALRAVAGYGPEYALEVVPALILPEREASVLAFCKAKLPCSIDDLLPPGAGGDKGRIDALATLAVLDFAGALRRRTAMSVAGLAGAPATIPSTTTVLDVPRTASLDRMAAVSPDAAAAGPGRRLPTLLVPTQNAGVEGSGPNAGAPGAAWQPEPFEAFAAKRAAAMNLDLANQENVAALETEYLARVVEAGVGNAAWATVLPLAERWRAKSPKNPLAIVAQARARFHVHPGEQPAVVEELGRLSSEFKKVADVQFAFADLALESGDRKSMVTAIKRFAELVPGSDGRLRQLISRRAKLERLFVPRPLTAVAVFLMVAGILAAASAKIGGGDELSFSAFDERWMLRHAVLLVIALILIFTSTKDFERVVGAILAVHPSDIALGLGAGVALGVMKTVLYGAGEPARVLLPIALVTVLAHVLVERLFFNVALQELLNVDDRGLAGVLGAMLLEGVFLLTYTQMWEMKQTLLMWVAQTAFFSSLPCALLWRRTRSLWGPFGWAGGLVVVDAVAATM
jgi:hypothetical protein